MPIWRAIHNAKMPLDPHRRSANMVKHVFGALAQLGERMAGSHEVRGSIPLCSTIKTAGQTLVWPALLYDFFCTTQIHHILHHKAEFRGSRIYAPRAVRAVGVGLPCPMWRVGGVVYAWCVASVGVASIVASHRKKASR